MPRRQMTSGGFPEITRPSNRIVPLVGRRAPEIMLKHVVLPAPLGPTRAVICPRFREKLTSSTARSPPKLRETFFSSSMELILGLARLAAGLNRHVAESILSD